MAGAQDREERREIEERRRALHRKSSKEEYWYPNQEKSQHVGWNAGNYFASREWPTEEITPIPPMYLTDNTSDYKYSRDNLQIGSIKITSIRGGLRWPIDVFGMVTTRDVLDHERKRNIIYARARSNCQTITEEHPYLALTGPSHAVVTCLDPGNIEIVLKVKGAIESEDRDLSFLVLTLKSSLYISYHRDYPSKRSTLKLEFHHIEDAVEATIIVRLTGGSSLPPGGFQGAFTASTANIDDVKVVLLAFRDGKLPVADDGTISLSRRVVPVGRKKDWLKVSVSGCAEDEQVATRDDVVFKPKKYGRSCGMLHIGACMMQVVVAWSGFE